MRVRTPPDFKPAASGAGSSRRPGKEAVGSGGGEKLGLEKKCIMAHPGMRSDLGTGHLGRSESLDYQSLFLEKDAPVRIHAKDKMPLLAASAHQRMQVRGISLCDKIQPFPGI